MMTIKAAQIDAIDLADYPPAPEHPVEIAFQGASGKDYRYFVCTLDEQFEPEPTNYVFAREVAPAKFVPVLVGETDDLQAVMDNHHMGRRLQFARATHICVHCAIDGPQARLAEKQDLVAYWAPICNR